MNILSTLRRRSSASTALAPASSRHSSFTSSPTRAKTISPPRRTARLHALLGAGLLWFSFAALPCAAWTGTDVGSVGVAGSESISGSAGTVTGSGADIWGTADAFRFAYQAITGDATFVVRVTAVGQTDPWAKAGIMIREDLTAGARNAFMFTGWNNNSGFQYRTTAGGSSSSNSGAWSWLSLWLKLERVGNTLTGYQSQDGTTWSQVGSISLAMSGTIYAGLAVTSHNNSAACTASFDNITLTTSGGGSWSDADIGSVTPAGSSSQTSGTFTVSGAGADIYGNADAFHYVYRSHTGDGTFIARVTAVGQSDPWAKAGIMIREDLSAGARNAFVFTGWNNNSGFQHRSTANQSTATTGGAWSWLSLWLKIVRTGTSIVGYQSQDGATWSQIASITLALPSSVYVGFAVTSHNNGTLCTATLDNVTFPGSNPPAAAPTFSHAPGNHPNPISVVLSSTTPGAVIHYTTTGAAPSLSSPTYSSAIPVNTATTIRAIAAASGYDTSPESSASYTIGGGTSAYAAADYLEIKPPVSGDSAIHLLSPTTIELVRISQKTGASTPIDHWDYVTNGSYSGPAAGAFTVLVNNQQVNVTQVGFKRRTLYAERRGFDLRIVNSLFLKLATPVPANATVTVNFSGGSFNTTADPLRFNPALHVNQEGYMPNWPKKAYVGYYLGNAGELDIAPNLAFELVDMSGNPVPNTSGTLQARSDKQNNGNPSWFNQKVAEADFSAFNPPTPGLYMLRVADMGVSLPFLIAPRITLGAVRNYALGLYHQRCGAPVTLPYSRFTHLGCHHEHAKIPTPDNAFKHSDLIGPWNIITEEATKPLPSNILAQTAATLTSSGAAVLPFRRTGTVDVSGGHHDAGDYSKYTNNSADLIHFLVFAADSLTGIGQLDNLGLPESGNGLSDFLDAAKWEADFLVKMQDITGSWEPPTDPNAPPPIEGAFHYLVYPRYGRYESGPPNNGVEQVVWPSQTSATASAIAALAQIGSSKAFKQKYPEKAREYRERAKLGWRYLMTKITDPGEGISQFGNDRTRPSNGFQRLLAFGIEFADVDDLAWAACQLFLATGDPAYETFMRNLFDPGSGATLVDGYKRMAKSYGNAVRSYAFAVQSERLTAGTQHATYLQDCVDEAYAAADAAIAWVDHSAYRVAFPDEAKSGPQIGWFIATSQALDLAVGHALSVVRNERQTQRQGYRDAILSTYNFDAGGNPVNAALVTGIGMKRQKITVHQWADSDHRLLPPSGIPIGSVREITFYGANSNRPVEPAQNAVTFPTESGQNFALQDRWSDNWNISAEFTHLSGARAMAAVAYLACMESGFDAAWTATTGSISNLPSSVTAGTPVTVQFVPPSGMTLDHARIVWEAAGENAGYGSSFTFTPTVSGPLPWIEAEATWPDGRRAVAAVNNLPIISFDLSAAPFNAHVNGTDATLTLNRTGSATAGLTVKLRCTSTGVGNWDYQQVSSATFAPGSSTATVAIKALRTDSNPSPNVHVTIDVEDRENDYRIGPPNAATVNLVP